MSNINSFDLIVIGSGSGLDVAYFSKNCKFVDEKTISIDEDQNIYSQKIVIASGTRPRIPKICLDNPKVLTIIGGGYICCELAHFFGALGTRINIVQRDNVLTVMRMTPMSLPMATMS